MTSQALDLHQYLLNWRSDLADAADLQASAVAEADEKLDEIRRSIAQLNIAIAALEPTPASDVATPPEIPEGWLPWEGEDLPPAREGFGIEAYEGGTTQGPARLYRYVANLSLPQEPLADVSDAIEQSSDEPSPAQPEPSAELRDAPPAASENSGDHYDEDEDDGSEMFEEDALRYTRREPEPDLPEPDLPEPDWNAPEGYAPVTNPEADALAKAQDYYSPEAVEKRSRFDIFGAFKREKEEA